jgi:hypothetical protein
MQAIISKTPTTILGAGTSQTLPLLNLPQPPAPAPKAAP